MIDPLRSSKSIITRSPNATGLPIATNDAELSKIIQPKNIDLKNTPFHKTINGISSDLLNFLGLIEIKCLELHSILYVIRDQLQNLGITLYDHKRGIETLLIDLENEKNTLDINHTSNDFPLEYLLFYAASQKFKINTRLYCFKNNTLKIQCFNLNNIQHGIKNKNNATKTMLIGCHEDDLHIRYGSIYTKCTTLNNDLCYEFLTNDNSIKLRDDCILCRGCLWHLHNEMLTRGQTTMKFECFNTKHTITLAETLNYIWI